MLHNYPARSLGLKFSDPHSLQFQTILKSSGIEELQAALEIVDKPRKRKILKELEARGDRN